MSEGPWYREWFGEEYLELYPHRDEEEGEAAVALLLARVPELVGERVLDLACGAGRHLLPLQEGGTTPVGLDLSLPLLVRARRDGVPVPLVRGDMRRLPFRDGCFFAVTSFFTSFGYFADPADDGRVLAEVRRVLRDEGHLLLDFLNADRVRDTLSPRDEEEIDGRTVIQERRLIEDDNVVEKRIQIRKAGVSRVFRERVRLYIPDELEALVERAGLSVVERFGDYSGGLLAPASPRVILLARAQ